jgi:hypothetical protein
VGIVGGCDCINSRTGEDKKRYATQSQADVACKESRKKYPDGDTLNTYYCPDGECWHVGNSSWDDPDESWEEKEQTRVRDTQIADFRKREKMRPTETADAGKGEAESSTAGIEGGGTKFFAKLMEDAQPKADILMGAASNVVSNLANSNTARVAKALGYKALVNTVGITACVAKPVPKLFHTAVNRLRDLLNNR